MITTYKIHIYASMNTLLFVKIKRIIIFVSNNAFMRINTLKYKHGNK